MSEIREILQLKPNHGCLVGGRDERLVSRGHDCPECHGTGWHFMVAGMGDIREACSVCHGTGKVDAIVTIHWQASEGGSKV